MIIGFDLDGTLVETWTATPLPGVRERLATLPAGCKTFIATNQAGPIFRAVLGDPKYPTAGEVATRIADGLAALDWRPDMLLIACYPGKDGEEWKAAANAVCKELSEALRGCGVSNRSISTWPSARKPGSRMLLEAKSRFKGERIARMLYIGDMDTDQAAAAAAGCRYLDAAQWRERGL